MQLLFVISLTLWACAFGDDEATVSPKSRVSKSPRGSSSSVATHSAWLNYAGYDPYANYDSAFYDPYQSKATHPPFPTRATHPPYPYKLQKDKDNTISSSPKKQLLKIDTDTVKTWFKDAFAYLSSPIHISSAITKAVKPSTSSGIPSPGRSFWAKMIASFKAVLKRNSEEKGQDLMKENVGSLLKRIHERTKLSSLFKSLGNQKVDAKVTNNN